MTQGSKQIETYYTIKVGNAFVKEIKIGGGFSNQKVYLKDLSLTQYDKDIKKWYFDSLTSVVTEDDHHQEKYFIEVLGLLKDNGMTYEVLKTTVETTEEQKEVWFVDGKEAFPESVSYRTMFEDSSEVKEGDELDVIIYKISQRAIKDHEDKKEEQMRIALQGMSITTTKLL